MKDFKDLVTEIHRRSLWQVDEPTANLGNAVAYPVFDSLREHPRFRAVMEAMGLRR